MTWHGFSPELVKLAAECAASQLSTEPFEVIGDCTNTAGTGARPVKMQSGLPAWAKPGRGSDGRIVGREKLAADLGHYLKLPVAPVIISRQTSQFAGALTGVVAISYETLASGRDWASLNATADEILSLRGTFTALWVFHGWIAERDHRGAGWNLKGERGSDGTMKVSSFDYVQSLNDQWTPPGAPTPPPDYQWGVPIGVYANPDRNVALTVIGEIQGLTGAQLGDMIGGLPEDCMPPNEGATLADGLFERGKQLKSLLGLE